MIVPPLDGFTHHNQLRVFVAERQGGALHCPARVCDPRQWGGTGSQTRREQGGRGALSFCFEYPNTGNA